MALKQTNKKGTFIPGLLGLMRCEYRMTISIGMCVSTTLAIVLGTLLYCWIIKDMNLSYSDGIHLYQMHSSKSELHNKESLDGMHQNNSALIDGIQRYWIIPPPKGPRVLISADRIYYSQVGQDKEVNHILGGQENGFFIECGGGDGETLSNSLFFEKTKNWTGLLIEADPVSYRRMLQKNRNAFLLNACLSTSSHSQLMDFSSAGVLGGLKSAMAPSHFRMIKKRITAQKKVMCFPLFSILSAINIYHIDYFSLDVEGAELDILNSIPWDRVTIDVLSVEYRVNRCDSCTVRKLNKLRALMKLAGNYEELHPSTIKGLDVLFHKLK